MPLCFSPLAQFLSLFVVHNNNSAVYSSIQFLSHCTRSNREGISSLCLDTHTILQSVPVWFYYMMKSVYCYFRNLGVYHVPPPPRNVYGQMTLRMWDAHPDIKPSLRCLGTSALAITSRRTQSNGHGSWQPRSMNNSFIPHASWYPWW